MDLGFRFVQSLEVGDCFRDYRIGFGGDSILGCTEGWDCDQEEAGKCQDIFSWDHDLYKID